MAWFQYQFRGGPIDGETRTMRDFPKRVHVPVWAEISISEPGWNANLVAVYVHSDERFFADFVGYEARLFRSGTCCCQGGHCCCRGDRE